MRKEQLTVGEHYHIYNRGTDKRTIVVDSFDSNRFIESMVEFNSLDRIGSLYVNSFRKQKGEYEKTSPLVKIVAYCLNPNHFHLILEQVAENGISKYMRSFIGGYSSYFNNRYERSGTLFQGPFKARHINSNGYLLHTSAYVNLNNRVHQLSDQVAKLVRSSWDEYRGATNKSVCEKKIILGQFLNPKKYESYALESLKISLQRKQDEELQKILAE